MGKAARLTSRIQSSMTSNLGSDVIQEQHETMTLEMKSTLTALLLRTFRPEFVNRIDETVVFHPLAMEHIHKLQSFS